MKIFECKPDKWRRGMLYDFCDLKMMWGTGMPDFNWWMIFFSSSSLELYDWVEEVFLLFLLMTFFFSLHFFLSLIPESYWVCSKWEHHYHHFTSEDFKVQEVNLLKVTGVINDTLELETVWLNLFFWPVSSILFALFPFFPLPNHEFWEYVLIGKLISY